jgi:trehalose-6-phosphate synthase
MPEATMVNPWDSAQVADQIHKALNMAPEQRKRLQNVLYDHLTTGNVQFYVDSMLGLLVQVLDSRTKESLQNK